MSYQRILILSSQFGGGHYNAGQALAEEFRAQSPHKTEVRHLDFGSFFHRKADYLIRKAWLSFVKRIPVVYGKLFDRTADITAENCSKLVRGHVARNVLDYIEEFNPDVIVNTHFLSAGILGELKRRGLVHTPLVTVVTDYMVHGLWLHPKVDLYLVGCQSAYDRLVKGGIDPDRVLISGIPVRSGFRSTNSKEIARKALGLIPDKQTILIMGGSEGFTGRADEIMNIVSSFGNVQFFLVCGNDEETFNKINSCVKDNSGTVRVYEYADNVHELMAASDLIITKGGGLTITEALTMGLPMVMYKPIPGHEEGNAVYVSDSGAGVVVQKIEELIRITDELLYQPKKLEEMAWNAKRMVPDNSSGKAVKSIIRQAHLGRVRIYDFEDYGVSIV